MNLAAFANPWEHARLLSDSARNAQMIALLERHAAGARVMEIGCGTGLLSCIAARLGAREVWAVEPTSIARVAREVVRANGLEGVVHVLDGRVEDLSPRPVELAFSELLNADPFAEGVLEAMEAARPWVVAGGRLAPSRLRVFGALARVNGPAREVSMAMTELARAARSYHLDLGPIYEGLATAGAYRYLGQFSEAPGAPTLLWDLELGVAREAAPVVVEMIAEEAGPIGGVVLWFDATLDPDLPMTNAPGAGGHWGQLVSAWPFERGMRAGERIQLRAWVGPNGVQVLPD